MQVFLLLEVPQVAIPQSPQLLVDPSQVSVYEQNLTLSLVFLPKPRGLSLDGQYLLQWKMPVVLQT